MNLTAAPVTAHEWLAELEAKHVSARELTEEFLSRIEAVNGRLHAAVTVARTQALSAADGADRARAAGERRALLGLPVTVKDSLETKGIVSTGGSLARARYVPERDATVVARLRAAGAIVLAKTNCPEYSASYETDNVVFGRTNHPLDAARTPGGSSGGEAALVASGATPLGFGTDGGGSIRVPAHYCGILGLRPTTGRVPDTGNWPATRASGHMDLYCVGPLARSARDVMLALRVISGPDGVDPYAVPAPLLDYETVNMRGLRVGWYVDAPGVVVTPGTREAVMRAVAALTESGTDCMQITPPWLPNPTRLFFDAILADGGRQLRADVAAAAGQHEERFRKLMRDAGARALAAGEWFDLQGRVYELRSQLRGLFADLDLLVSPVAAGPAPLHGTPPAGIAQSEYDEQRAFDFVHLVAIGGLPAVSVPVGTEAGLPVGVQIAAAPFREDVALAAASYIEDASPDSPLPLAMGGR